MHYKLFLLSKKLEALDVPGDTLFNNGSSTVRQALSLVETAMHEDWLNAQRDMLEVPYFIRELKTHIHPDLYGKLVEAHNEAVSELLERARLGLEVVG